MMKFNVNFQHTVDSSTSNTEETAPRLKYEYKIGQDIKAAVTGGVSDRCNN